VIFYGLYQGSLKGAVWEYAFFLAAGISVLAKGPVSLILSGSIILLFIALKKRWDLFRRLAFHPGMILAVAVFFSWYGSALWIGGEKFFGLQFIKENFARFFVYGEGGTGHQKPIYYFISYLFTLGLPWTLLLPFVLVDYFRWKNFKDDRDLFLSLRRQESSVHFAIVSTVGFADSGWNPSMAASLANSAPRTEDRCVDRGGDRRVYPASGAEQPVRPGSILAFSCY